MKPLVKGPGDDSANQGGRAALAGAVASALAAQPRPAPGLHIVATPIGNLADISLRALSVLAGADLVACEDTRMTRRLLDRYGLTPKLVSYHEHNAAARRPELLGHLDDGRSIALVSDAGTPLVSDPGYKLVREVATAGHPVFAVPGPSAVLAALVVSGLPTDRFWFEGFLPPKQGARRRRIGELAKLEASLVFFESPRRLADALADLAEAMGAREAVIARELTKRFETAVRGTLSELAARFADEGAPKGEIVIVVGPASQSGEQAIAEPELDLDRRLGELIPELGTREAAVRIAAETGLKRRDLYQRALRIGAGRGGDD